MKAPASGKERTPVGHLAEAGLHGVLGYQLAQASIATTAVFVREVGVPDDVRPVEYTLLTLIQENPGVTAARLAKALAVTKPNITMWVDRLVARSWVQREPSRTDGRSMALKATSAGARLAGRATRRLLSAEADTFQQLSAGERAILLELLHKVAAMR
jgi:DNA-binding MarR family transcriptional regulator